MSQIGMNKEFFKGLQGKHHKEIFILNWQIKMLSYNQAEFFPKYMDIVCSQFLKQKQL